VGEPSTASIADTLVSLDWGAALLVGEGKPPEKCHLTRPGWLLSIALEAWCALIET
jgi:hypothetical protein